MPVLNIYNIHSGGLLGVWKLTENVEELLPLCKNDEKLIQDTALIHHPKKKAEFLASRLLLKKLCREIDFEYQDIEKNDRKKPYLKEYHGHISISHTEAYCAVIIHPQLNVGIDVEKIQPKLELVKHKFLGNQELQNFTTLEMLAIAWSAKEAMYKKLDKIALSFKNEIQLRFECDQLLAYHQKEVHQIHVIRLEEHVLSYVL